MTTAEILIVVRVQCMQKQRQAVTNAGCDFTGHKSRKAGAVRVVRLHKTSLGRTGWRSQRPCRVAKRLARIRFIAPCCGTPCGWPGMSSSTPFASFAKSTTALNWLMSPLLSAVPCRLIPPPRRRTCVSELIWIWHGLVEAKRDIEKRRRSRQRARASRAGRRGCEHGNQVAIVLRDPQPHSGRETHRLIRGFHAAVATWTSKLTALEIDHPRSALV